MSRATTRSAGTRLLVRLTRPAVALPLLGLAITGWALVAHIWLRDLPVRRHLERGMELARLGQGAEAEREWKAALRQNRDCAPAYQLLGGYYLSCQHWASAAMALRKFHELAPAEPHVSCLLAGALLNARDEVAAYREAEAELRQAPDCVPALAIAAVLLAQARDEPRRLAYLRRLGRLCSDDPDMLFLLADGLTESYAYAEARPVLEQALRLEPQHPEALTLLGEGWLNDHTAPDHLERAEAALTRALARQPLNGRARLALGRVYRERGKPGAAILELEEAARLLPLSFQVPFELAQAYDAAHRPDAATAARRRFLALRQLASAEGRLEKRCSTNPNSFDDHYRMGLLQLHKGDYRRASFYLRKARALRPHHPLLLAALRSLNDQTALAARLDAVQARITTRGRTATPSRNP